MGTRIRILAGDVTVEGVLDDGPAARALEEGLPLEGEGTRWGEEVYFEVPLEVPAEDLTTEVEVGEIGYWPPGKAIAIFFGPTPLSDGEAPVPASGVSRLGKIDGDPKVLRSVRTGQRVRMEKVD